MRLADWAAWIESRCHVLYAVLAVPAIVWLALWMPPFQNPDEFEHFSRADQISHGGLIGSRMGMDASGGWVDAALPQATRQYESMPYRFDQKLTAGQIDATRRIPWSGELRFATLRSTANYGPAAYTPPVVGIWIARAAGLGIIDSLYSARLVNGLFACLLSFGALRVCARGRALMFTVLMWPMTLSLFASSSHDALLVATAILGIAILSRVTAERRPASRTELLVVVLAMAVGVMGRPPHVAFFLLLPLAVAFQWRAMGLKALAVHAAIVLTGAAMCVGWYVAVWAYSLVPSLNVHDGASTSGQLAFLMAHPASVVPLAFRSAAFGWKSVVTTTIGVLGWLDTPLPEAYYKAACVVALLAVATETRDEVPDGWRGALWAGATLASFVVLVYAAVYITLTEVGATKIIEVQGRYFLAAVPLVAWLVPPVGARQPAGRLRRSVAWAATIVFPLVAYAVVPWAIFARYYAP